MNKKVKNDLYLLSYKISELKIISKILYYSIENRDEFLSQYEIATLSGTLNRKINFINNKMQKIQLKLKM